MAAIHLGAKLIADTSTDALAMATDAKATADEALTRLESLDHIGVGTLRTYADVVAALTGGTP